MGPILINGKTPQQVSRDATLPIRDREQLLREALGLLPTRRILI